MTTKLFATLSLALVLTACSTQSPYKPADGSRYGYEESRITADRYRVTFTGRPNQRDKVRDYALLRAAELTLLEGYDWFAVLGRETETSASRPEPSASISATHSETITRDCGLLGCTTTHNPHREVGASASTGTSLNDQTQTVLEIRLGKGVRPEGLDSFDAREVRENLRDRLDLAEE